MILHATYSKFTLAAFTFATFGAGPVFAQPIYEYSKLVAPDAALGDQFGESVAISGTTAIVGASENDDAGYNSGTAYLYDTLTGLQLAKLSASDGVAGDHFGCAVAISGTIAIIGAYGNDDAGVSSGSAYIFDTLTGEQIFKLTASDAAANDRFGWSVAISGTTAIVGAYLDDDAGSSSGSAYLFDTESGLQIAKLNATDAAEADRFGFSVGISGTTAIVGARLGDYDKGVNSGAAYLFDTVNGDQLFKLTASDSARNEEFGWSVGISGTTAIVGAHADEDVGFLVGSAYLFDTLTGLQLYKLTASDAAGEDQFGISVAISGTTAIVGARLDDDDGFNVGAVYLFDTATGLQLSKFNASDAATEDWFGDSVAISGTTAIAGAYRDDHLAGSAYLLDTEAEPVDPCPADLNDDGELDFLDISMFYSGLQSGDPLSDLNGDGEYDFLDFSVFTLGFYNGCPE